MLAVKFACPGGVLICRDLEFTSSIDLSVNGIAWTCLSFIFMLLILLNLDLSGLSRQLGLLELCGTVTSLVKRAGQSIEYYFMMNCVRILWSTYLSMCWILISELPFHIWIHPTTFFAFSLLCVYSKSFTNPPPGYLIGKPEQHHPSAPCGIRPWHTACCAFVMFASWVFWLVLGLFSTTCSLATITVHMAARAGLLVNEEPLVRVKTSRVRLQRNSRIEACTARAVPRPLERPAS